MTSRIPDKVTEEIPVSTDDEMHCAKLGNDDVLRVDLNAEPATVAMTSHEHIQKNTTNDCEYIQGQIPDCNVSDPDIKRENDFHSHNLQQVDPFDTTYRSRSSTEENCYIENDESANETTVKEELDIEKYDIEDDSDFDIKITRTFSLAFAECKSETDTLSVVSGELKGNSKDDYLLTDLDACEKEKGSITSNITCEEANESNAQSPESSTSVSSPRLEENTSSDAQTVTKEIIHDKIGVSIIDLDRYDENFNSMNSQNNKFNNLNLGGSTNFFSAEIHVISNDTQVDFLAEKTPKVVLAPNSSFFSDHSYHYIPKDEDHSNQQTVTKDCSAQHKEHGTDGDRLHSVTSEHRELESNPYENLEFSSIFASLDDYPHSLDQNFAQHCVGNNSSPSFVTNFDNQICDDLASDSGIFDLSVRDSTTNGTSFKDSAYHYYDMPHLYGPPDNQMLTNDPYNKTDKLCDTVSVPSTGNFSVNYPDSNPVFQYRQYPNYSDTAAPLTISAAAPHSMLTELHADPSLHETCEGDYYKHYQNYDSGYSHNGQTCSAAPYPEWSSWNGYEASYDNPSCLLPLRQPSDTNWSGQVVSLRDDDVGTPEIVQFLQMESNEDEETDDADELNDVSLPLSQTANDSFSDNTAPGSVATTSYQSDDGSVMTAFSPVALTPPPSASSTPVPSSSQDSHTSEDLGFFSPWPVPHYELPKSQCTTSRQLSTCKLSSQLLESGLLNYGLTHGVKRPFPSMADVMRNNRNKASSKQRHESDSGGQVFRRSGRPRKNQIQSDKISTSTTMNMKKKKKMSKSTEHDSTDPNNGPEDALNDSENNNGALRVARHNEPLNQQAIEIMTQWFEDHVDNPYPSKADKEEMARLGGITENQVKSWFANKRNRTNNTKPKVQKRAMEEKLKELFRDLKRSHRNPMADNSHLIQQLSGIIQNCHSAKQQE